VLAVPVRREPLTVDRSQKAFVGAIGVTVILALLPDTVLDYLQDVSDIVNFPLMPARDGVNALTRLAKPEVTVAPPEFEERSREALYGEVEEWRRKHWRLERRILELEQLVEQLQKIPLDRTDVLVKPLVARITGRDPKDVYGAVNLNRGAREGVHIDAIAVRDGVHLIGRVTTVSPFQCALTPVTNETTGLLRARVIPMAGGDEMPLVAAAAFQLLPDGKGAFAGELAQEHAVAVGDAVILDDGTWPESAQATTIGRVTVVRPKDEAPLRNIVEVAPVYQVYDITSVPLLVELTDGEGEPGEAGGTGAP
jgi:hypothetical protein